MKPDRLLSAALVAAVVSIGMCSAQGTDDLEILKNTDWSWKSIEGTRIETGHASVEVFDSRQSISLARFPMEAHVLDVVVANGQEAGIVSRIAGDNDALLAINGSYFDKKHEGITFVKDGGRVVPSVGAWPLRHCNALLRLKGNRRQELDICLVTDTLAFLKDMRRWTEGMISGPLLLEDGRMIDYDSKDSAEDAGVVIEPHFYRKFYIGRHPRTVMGYTSDGWVYFIVVDGRFPSLAEGMTIRELQILSEALGLYEAMNLDGGGSSTLWTRSEGVLNHPSDNKVFDHDGERVVPNVIVVK